MSGSPTMRDSLPRGIRLGQSHFSFFSLMSLNQIISGSFSIVAPQGKNNGGWKAANQPAPQFKGYDPWYENDSLYSAAFLHRYIIAEIRLGVKGF